jgi:hypothetical protein
MPVTTEDGRALINAVCYSLAVSRAPTSLEEELAQLTPEQRAWVEADLALRAKAHDLAARLGLDEGDVYHQLKQLRRSPSERLRMGLGHGRLRRRIPE